MAKPPAYTPIICQPSSLPPPISGPSPSTSSSSTTGASYSIDNFCDSLGLFFHRFTAWFGTCPCIVCWNSPPCCSDRDCENCRINNETCCNGACGPCGQMFDALGMLARDVCTCAECEDWRKTILGGLVVLGLIWWIEKTMY